MKIPIVNGIFTDDAADFRTSYPLNLIPVPKQTGINEGYLRTAEGMVLFCNNQVPGDDPFDRGAMAWDGICYRVIGKYLVRVNENGLVDLLGEVGTDGKPVTMDNGFDYLSVSSAGDLYYCSKLGVVTKVTDPDAGLVIDHIWISGYTMITDGATIAVTELNDPFEVNPLKYGSSEASPDPIKRLFNIDNQAVALNRLTTEFFANVGGSGFPFRRVEGAMIPKGCVGTFAACEFQETFAFVGGGKKESTSVWIGAQGQAAKIATREIETILGELTEAQQEDIVLESRSEKMHEFLYMHLPDRTMVYDAAGSRVLGEPVWFTLQSALLGETNLPYRARYFVNCYGKWLFGDTLAPQVGYLTSKDARQFGQYVAWQFDTPLLYNESRGAIVHGLELVRLPGRRAVNPTLLYEETRKAAIYHSYTEDGLNWSEPRPCGATRPGTTAARTTWRHLGRMRNYRGMRFRGMNNPYPDAFARLEANLEALAA